MFERTLMLTALVCAAPLAAQEIELDLVNAFPDQKRFSRPLFIEYPPHDAEHCYVVEQTGKVVRVRRDGQGDSSTFADLSRAALHPKNGGHNEEGLLGFAFDPAFGTTRHVFVYYSEKTGEESYKDRRGRKKKRPLRQSVLSRMTVDADTDSLDKKSELRIFELEQPWGNHNGGTIVFGPDEMLYVALGDGGARADRGGNGQNLGTLLGAVLRIDVRGATEAKPYGIPDDNPFVKTEGARGEIFAYGLRNPWRISFDRETGDLWCGDVGQDKHEEVDRLVSGGNYGWPIREASHPFPPKRDGRKDSTSFIEPVAEYGRTQGISITGGYVYRGAKIPELVGCFVYGDFATNRMWAVREDREGGEHTVYELGKAKGGIASFGERPDGELQVLCFNGRIYDLVPASE